MQQPIPVGFQVIVQLPYNFLLSVSPAFGIFFIVDTQFGFLFVAKFPNRILNYVFCNVLGRVKNTVFFSLAFAFVNLLSGKFCGNGFNFAKAVFKNMPQDVYIHLTLKIVIGQLHHMGKQDVIINQDIVKHFICLKQSPVVSKNVVNAFLPFSAGIDIPEILFKNGVQGFVGIFFLQYFPPVHNSRNGIGWQQPAVFSKKDKQETVEQFLGFLKQQEFIFLRVVFHHVLPQVRAESGIILIKLLGYFFFFEQTLFLNF
ncbi:MAG: hypothetical protein K9H64_08575 [Bacteroidales bacterium]|nr:hypothetical protein [Bacteroidales bacterium]MCF8455886.1 hypothetical protein [Bacteroidales bacterium]